jgi:uncharacterized membrane protein (TIGR02234 family)
LTEPTSSRPTNGQTGAGRRARLTSRPAVLSTLLLGGLLALVCTAQPWWRAAGDGADVAFTGTDATTGLSQALAVVALAGTLLVLVLRAKGRRIVAVLLAAVGAGLALVGALRVPPGSDTVRSRIREVSLVDQYALSPTGWPWVFAAAGVLVLLGAAGLLVGAPHWSSSATRFERSTSAAEGAVTAADLSDDPAAVWKALDAGIDPTTTPERGHDDSPRPPDVHFEEARDTMVANTDHNRSARHTSGRNGPDHSASAGRSTPSPE